MENKREIWIDWLRVIACFMVMVVHSTEPFYLGDGGGLVQSASDAFWAAFIDTLMRCCVPLFLVASSYLQFPVHYSTGEFFRRRAVRVLIPLLVWSVVYALVWGEPAGNFVALLQNFNYAAGHLWFVYMLAGLYLIMPLLSPWAEKVSKRELSIYLAIWLFTTILPSLRVWLGGQPLVVYGPSGIPNIARYPLWGECSWNANGTFYYISGLAGYLLVGLYFRRFAGEWSAKKSLFSGLGCFLSGFALSFFGFWHNITASASGVWPCRVELAVAAAWETPIMYEGTGVALMTIGAIILLRRITASGAFYRRAVLPISKASYGMYLMHMLILSPFAALYRDLVPSTPAVILLTAVNSYICVAACAVLLQKMPKIGKYICG